MFGVLEIGLICIGLVVIILGCIAYCHGRDRDDDRHEILLE